MDYFVSMDQYWTKVATPFLLLVSGFGIWTLFNLSPVQVSARPIREQVAKVMAYTPKAKAV